jgi:mannose/fructose/N-acetylgalactosamine-specific phosphotransferase system component IID
MNDKIKLTFWDFVRIFFRTLILQAVWNFKSLLSVGVSFALVPVARRLYKDKKDQAKMLRRHLYFFNAQPYFASFALGAIARLEEDRVNGAIKDTAKIETFKNALIGPLGAVGDLYFWGTIKPAAILLGLAGALYLDSLSEKLVSVLLMLLVFNVPHLQIRAIGLWKGYKSGFDIYKSLKSEKFARIRKAYQIGGALLLGMIIAFLLITTIQTDYMQSVVFVLGILMAGVFHKYTAGNYLAVIGSIGIAIIIGLI